MRRAAALSLIASLALLPSSPQVRAANEAPRTLGNSHAPLLFSADEMQFDRELGLVIAKGNVEISQEDQILLADTVTYNQRTDTVTASGHVSLLQPTGDIVFADFIELHDDMRDGFIKDVRMLLSDRSRLAANTGRRVGGKRIEMRRGVFSPCELCRDDPSAPPLWQIKAEQIVDDKVSQTVEYRDAVMEIAGIPVFYAPYFSHPDPSVKRQSGFLPPTVGTGNTLGYHTTIPYYWVLGPDKDATFRPIFTTKAGQVLDGQYRERFGDGKLQVDGSVAFDAGGGAISTTNPTPPPSSTRGHVFGSGELDLDDNWRTGFDLQRESDLTYMLRYHFPTPQNFLTSRLYGENFGANSYANISAYGFQSLNPEVGDSASPFVLPVATYGWISDPDRLGGRLGLQGNVINLAHPHGTDTRRLSLGSDWRLPFSGPIGDRYSFIASLRTDGYSSNNLLLEPTDTSTHTEFAGRVFPQMSLKWNYPWVRTGASGNALIEPIAAVVAGPNGGNPAAIPNEDSQGFEFDETSLFVPNRFPGYDLIDTGQRVDYGLRGELNTLSLGRWETLIGESYRFQQASAFAPGSGLSYRRSDVVGRVVLSTGKFLDFVYRYRLDRDDLAMRRQEASISIGPTNLRVNLSYISIRQIPGIVTPQPGAPITGDQISTGLTAALTRYWSFALTDTRNVAGGNGATINSGATVTYRDDCFAVIASLTQSGISIGDVHPGVSMVITFVFKDLGEIGARAFSESGS
ncbi:MAG TPA: LPS assembly protein LptD [Stellaceae bacterium]|nr:LPS assembly protein LptD [Stellaceae bacterium]